MEAWTNIPVLNLQNVKQNVSNQTLEETKII
jgi:hypothetical protein